VIPLRCFREGEVFVRVGGGGWEGVVGCQVHGDLYRIQIWAPLLPGHPAKISKPPPEAKVVKGPGLGGGRLKTGFWTGVGTLLR
jgi:hypothetical protein